MCDHSFLQSQVLCSFCAFPLTALFLSRVFEIPNVSFVLYGLSIFVGSCCQMSSSWILVFPKTSFHPPHAICVGCS